MNKLLFVAGLLVLFVSQSMAAALSAEDEAVGHNIEKRSTNYGGKPGYQPRPAGYKGYSTQYYYPVYNYPYYPHYYYPYGGYDYYNYDYPYPGGYGGRYGFDQKFGFYGGRGGFGGKRGGFKGRKFGYGDFKKH
ncbi:prisilkin-39-like [Liolophura sinensis]|uniref:prisilkin-39-like n=1 Tax=Liolophura sinensis TaxID=3198878 RepID=UPI003158DCBE